MILPADIGEDANQLNEKIILKQLNDNNCFDVELQLNENDILELNFTLKDDQARSHNSLRFDGGYLVYAFKFKKGKWKKDNYNPFEIAFEEIYQGKIVRPFAKSKRWSTAHNKKGLDKMRDEE